MVYNKFTSKLDALSRAVKRHACLDCRYWQTEIYKDCPKCGSKNRQFFMSDAEFKRGMMLLTMQEAGSISDLKFQVPFPLEVMGEKLGKYIADSSYRNKDGVLCVEDVKGSKDHIDGLAKWKMKHFKAQYGMLVKIHAKN